MTIEITAASKFVTTRRRRRKVLRSLTVRVGPGDRVALLATKNAEKALALDVLSGSKFPDGGKVDFVGRTSWPLPGLFFLSPIHSAATNIRFIARLHEVDADRLMKRVVNMTDCGESINSPLKKWRPVTRQELAYAIGACIRFDTYIFDEHLIVGRPEFQLKCAQFLTMLRPHQGFLVATRAEDVIRQYCTSAYILDRGETTYYRAVGPALRDFRKMLSDQGDSVEEEQDSDEEAEESDMF